MTKEEIVSKLNKIKSTAFPTVVTTDMGVQFDVITPTGAYTYLGAIGDWPAWCFNRIDEKVTGLLKSKLQNNEKFSSNDFFNTDIYLLAKKLEKVDGVDLTEYLKDIVNYPYSDKNKFVYVYCDLGQWKPEVRIFDNEMDFSEAFFNEFPGSQTWDILDANAIESYYEALGEHEEGIPFSTSSDLSE